METKLKRIEEMSRSNPNMEFTSLYHLINKELLMECHKQLDGKKAVGIDGVSKEEYEVKLEDNINKLVEQLKNKAYKPQPANKIYIPKSNGKKRPLAISTYQDKIVQLALKKVIESVFEPRFRECMFGFRPNRSCHDALKRVNKIIENEKVNFVLDADVKGFFDNLEHEWITKFINVKIKDPNILKLANKILKAGTVDKGAYKPNSKGAGQGSLCSPIFANIYMHYMLSLWFYKEIKPKLIGYAEIVIYADDFICCFQHKSEAEQFNRMLIKRFQKFGLELEETKTRLIEFGRNSDKRKTNKDKEKPETFNFLGFTHYCSKGRKGQFRVKRKTEKKKFNLKVKELSNWLKNNRNIKASELIKKLNIRLIGHFRYFGITDNSYSISNFALEASKYLFKWLNRRSQKRSYSYKEFNEMLKYIPLVKPRTYINIYKT